MKKLLFIKYKTNDGIAEGGVANSQTNYDCIKSIFGKENTDAYALHDFAKGRTLIDKGFGALRFFRNMHFGIKEKTIIDIINLCQNYEIVFIDRSVFGILAKRLKESNYSGKIITFFHNFEPIFFEDSISKLNPIRNIILRSVKTNEQWACNYSDKIIALNQRDATLIIKHYGRNPDILIPVSFKNTYHPSESIQSKVIEKIPQALFFGSYFPANADGIIWFCKEVLPYVNIKLCIVGKGMEKTSSQINICKKIQIHGAVSDLQPYIEEADFIISPIFKGSGMKVKTCEALMYGKNIIGSKEAFEGYDIDFTQVGALADTKTEFIEAIQHFSTQFPRKFNTSSRLYYLENHSEEATLKRFETLFNSFI